MTDRRAGRGTSAAAPVLIWTLVGVLFALSGLLLNRWAIEEMFVGDEDLEARWLPALHSMQAGLVLAGALFVWRPLRRWAPLATLLLAGALLACSVGAYGTALRMGWLHHRVKTLEELCEWLPESDHPVVGRGYLARQQHALAEAETNAQDSEKIIKLRLRVAQLLLGHGRVPEAIESLEATLEFARSRHSPLTNRVRRLAGVAHLRSGELSHCLGRHNPDSCLFPIKRNGIWSNVKEAEKAIGYFREYLRQQPDDLGVRWLLNLTTMAAGRYPEGVPREFFIAEREVPQGAKLGEFKDIAPQLGLDTPGLLGGVILDDFDRDGWLDIMKSAFEPCTPLRYFHNNGDGTFLDWTSKAKLERQYGGFNLVQADYNNDGLLDLLVLRGGWMRGEYGRQRNSLLRQNPDGTFTDVTETAGLGDRAYPCQAAAWADYDNDGDLDLFIGNEGPPCQLFRNNGDGTFTDVARQAGVANHLLAKGVAWGDYDNDGDPDLYVSNYNGPNRLYRNDGGAFTDVAAELGVDLGRPGQIRTFTTWFWDVNNDGWLDLWVGPYGLDQNIEGAEDSLKLVVADYLGLTDGTEPVERGRLFLNDGSGRFRDASREMNVDHILLTMGGNYGDVDNDGFPDFYLGTGAPPFDYLVPNVLYQNVGGRSFVDATAVADVGHLQKGHAVAFGDLDNDGDLDLYAVMGGWFPADVFYDAVFQNPGNDNRWITIRLIGVKSNKDAIGVRIRLVVPGEAGPRSIHAFVSSGGSFGASSLQQEIGLGSADRIDELEVYWPTSRIRQRFNDVAVNQIIEIREDAKSYRRAR